MFTQSHFLTAVRPARSSFFWSEALLQKRQMNRFRESSDYATGSYNLSDHAMINPKDMSIYTDSYFTKAREAAVAESLDPPVIWQIFQKRNGIFCGLGLLKPILEAADEV